MQLSTELSENISLFSKLLPIGKSFDLVTRELTLGNTKAFISDVKRKYNVVGTITFPDHHVYSVSDIERIVAKLKKHPKAMLLTTEKDTVKLRRSRRVPDIMRERLFYQPVQVEFLEGSDVDFLGTLKSDLEGKVHLDSVPKR